MQQLDEVARQVTLRLSGYFICTACTYDQQITLYSFPTRRAAAEGVPPSRTIELPSGSQTVSEEVTLPLYGTLFRYPFDTYPLVLGVSMEQVSAKGDITPVARADGRAHLTLAVRDEARLALEQLEDPQVLERLQTLVEDGLLS